MNEKVKKLCGACSKEIEDPESISECTTCKKKYCFWCLLQRFYQDSVVLCFCPSCKSCYGDGKFGGPYAAVLITDPFLTEEYCNSIQIKFI